MLTVAQNERVTRVGPGTPMGETFRRYWLPAVMSEELKENDGAPLRVRLLGEDLVAFRDSQGHVGLVSAYCPHRRAPMFFGRNEECGLRCVYHGWKFDRSGACVDMPSEPPDSLFKTKVRIEAYPTWEGGGLLWTYMGPASTAPPPPNYELVRVFETHRFVSKTFEECNYLQALEGALDSTHASIMHHGGHRDLLFLSSYEQIVPRIDLRETDYGFVCSGIRSYEEKQWVRASQYFMPSMHMRGTVQSVLGRQVSYPTLNGHIWVPIDDTHTWVYNYMYAYFPNAEHFDEVVKATENAQGRAPGSHTADFRPTRNLANDYLIDRELQKSGRSFTGIEGVNTQDFAVQEGMGPIVDRSKERLSAIDGPIIVARRLLLEATDAVASGRMPRGSDPASHQDARAADQLIPKGVHWHEALRDQMKALY